MGQTKGIAIRIDSDLLTEIENHNLSRNELVTKALESYLASSPKKAKKKTKKKKQSAFSEITETPPKQETTQEAANQQKNQQISTETITDNLYHEIYSTIYNTEVSPLKKQLELKNDLISTLQQQNTLMQEDKRNLFDHINKLEERIPKKRSLFKK